MADNYVDLPVEGGGGGPGAGVTSINGADGALTLTGDGVLSVDTFGTVLTLKAESATLTIAGFDSSGVLNPIPGFYLLVNTGGYNINLLQEPDSTTGYLNVNQLQMELNPTEDSPDSSYALQEMRAYTTSGNAFDLGYPNGNIALSKLYVSHTSSGNIGNVTMHENNFEIGNGTDAIALRGVSYSYGFGVIRDNVTIENSIQGYGFQPQVEDGATLNAYVQAFYDNANVQTASNNGHTSFASNPNLSSIPDGTNYTGVQINPTIGTIEGYSQSIASFPNITTVETDTGYSVLNTSPTVSNNKGNVTGVSVNMDNVTNYAGAQASIVVQDITYTRNVPEAAGNNLTVEYTNTTTAGNEVANLVASQHIVVSIESGVSTATQVLAAISANFTISSNVTAVITGVASNPQVTFAETNFSGGENPGSKEAAYFKGNVRIEGALSFTGGLNIGSLNSFASVDISGYPSGVNSIDTLITQPFVPASTSLTTDLLAINTAMLLQVGDNSTLTSSFLGYTALGLPAVAALGAGATVDLVCGAAFALSLDATAGVGSSIAEVALCRAISIPNGITSVGRLSGYKMDLPFGDPGTISFGVNITPNIHNYMAGDLVVGGAPVSDDLPVNSSVGLELKSTVKAFLPSRMDQTQRDALTAVNGMVLYNTTTDKLQVYAAGAWVDLH